MRASTSDTSRACCTDASVLELGEHLNEVRRMKNRYVIESLVQHLEHDKPNQKNGKVYDHHDQAQTDVCS
jgi:hypothetical protein